MNKNKEKLIMEILEDLYNIDNNFRAYENDLKKIIVNLIELRPDSAFDENFKRKLQARLINEIELLQRKKSTAFSFSGLFSNNRVPYAFGGAFLVLLLLIVPGFFLLRNYLISEPEEVLNPIFSVESLTERAFGQLNLAQGSEAAEDQQPAPAGLGGGGGGGIPDIASSRISEIAPDFVSHTYIYKGEDLVLDKNKVEVLKRIKEIASSSAFNNIVKSLDFGLLKMSSFPNSKVERISFAQDSGYIINVDFLEGAVYIDKNWRLEQGVVKCVEDRCVEPQPLAPSDIPSDSDLIKIADNFVKNHGIDLSMYGQPEVTREWKWLLTRSEDYYIPFYVQVVYPLTINEDFVYDEWGNKVGFIVSINLRDMEVNNVYGLTSHNYQKSSYEAETDFSKIVSIAENGGIRDRVFYGDTAVKTVEIELSTPSFVYMRAWNYKDGQSEELLVPSLMFPIIDSPDSYYRESVVVPLVTDLISNNIFGPFPALEIAE